MIDTPGVAVSIVGGLIVFMIASFAIDARIVDYQLNQARMIVNEGDQLWPDGMEYHILVAEEVAFDKSALADRLASDANGSLAAEGMLMEIRHPTCRSRQILTSHLQDLRVNYMLYTNGDLAKICLKALNMEGRNQLTPDQRSYLKKWTARSSNGR